MHTEPHYLQEYCQAVRRAQLIVEARGSVSSKLPPSTLMVSIEEWSISRVPEREISLRFLGEGGSIIFN